MAKKKHAIYPAAQKELGRLGQRLKDARLRRRFSMEIVCARANITRPTLTRIEQGNPSVSFGHYVQVLRILGLLSDLSLLAGNDVVGRKLQDESLPQAHRAPRRKKEST